jgi:GTP-binding protein
VAIVGRANVGKSTLFNRLIRKRLAIVEDLPGTTRDRLYADTSWESSRFTLIDTGGLETKPASLLGQKVGEQVKAAMAEADVILFMVDVREGLTAADWEIGDALRGSQVPILLVANKADSTRHDPSAAEFHSLGLGDPIAVSAYHGRQLPSLMDELATLLPHTETPPDAPGLMKVAIIGRPNVGKSMLLNAILGEDRAIVSETPGTTRDSLDTVLHYDGQEAVLIDTAGLRRRGQVKAGAEYYSVLRTLRAIGRSDVSLMVIDGSEGITAQDLHVAGYINDANRGIIVLINKWDIVSAQWRDTVDQEVRERLKFMPYATVMHVSALLNQGIQPVLPKAETIWKERQRRVSPDELARFLEHTMARHGPPRAGMKRTKFFSVEQSAVDPPTFAFTLNEPESLHFSYQRYLENSLRQSFGFHGTPLRLVFRKNPARRRGLLKQTRENSRR